ncbi:MAG: Glucose--fructose oxidoreductase precursor [Lentisphaerae bacterium ADurb.Bin242]|nr:MAG: Glucose--fructose oxidoreductase precursor [Lentisphaerae bacterium ADurb.Bin242]
MKFKVAVIGLKIGTCFSKAAVSLPDTELVIAYDRFYRENTSIDYKFYEENHIRIAASEDEIYASDADVVVVASPDHFHAEQSVRALRAGKHVICEKPLAPTLDECRRIIAAVKESGRQFMIAQVGRYSPGFETARALLNAGRIGRLVCLETEYAHDYTHSPGFMNWRRDPAIKRQGFLGGGCHALDLARWLAGDPLEVFCYMNHLFLPDWPAPDTGIAIAKFPGDAIGRVFVSIGVKRPYTMRTSLYGTGGTIICDNTSPSIQISESSLYKPTANVAFAEIPVSPKSHNHTAELKDFIDYLKRNEPTPTNVYEGAKTVLFAESAIRSAETGQPVKIVYDLE